MSLISNAIPVRDHVVISELHFVKIITDELL